MMLILELPAYGHSTRYVYIDCSLARSLVHLESETLVQVHARNGVDFLDPGTTRTTSRVCAHLTFCHVKDAISATLSTKRCHFLTGLRACQAMGIVSCREFRSLLQGQDMVIQSRRRSGFAQTKHLISYILFDCGCFVSLCDCFRWG